MPRIPTYGLPTQELRPAPNVRQSTGVPGGAFGTEVGGELRRLGAVGIQRGTEIKAEDSDRRALDTYYSAVKTVNGMLYGEGEGSGYLNLPSNQSAGAYSRFQVDVEKVRTQALEGLTGFDAAGKVFEKLFNQYADSTGRQVSRYEGQQRQVAIGETVDEAIRTAINVVQLGGSDPEALREATDMVRLAAIMSGMSQVDLENTLEAITGEAHKATIDELLLTDPAAALAYYKEHKAEIPQRDRERIERVAQATSQAQKAQSKADELFLKHGDDETRMLQEARKIKDPALRDDVVRRVKVQSDEARSIADEQQQAVDDAAWSPQWYADPAPEMIPPQSSAANQKAMWTWLRASARREAPKSDPQEEYRLDNLTDDELLKENIAANSKLTRATRNIYKGRQQDIKAGKGDAWRTQAETLNQEYTRRLKSIGIKTDSDEGVEFLQQLKRHIKEFETTKGAAATRDEQTAIMDALLISGEVVTPWRPWEWDIGHFFQATDKEVSQFYTEITGEERKRIIKGLEEAGTEVNEVTITSLWLKARLQPKVAQ